MSSADVALQRAHAYLEDARDPTLDTSLRAEALEQARVALLDARRSRASPEHMQPVFEALLQNSIEDRSHTIRSVVPQAIEDLCLRDMRAFVPTATPFLSRALHDSNVLVAARAVRTLTTLFRKLIGFAVSVSVGAAGSVFPEAVLETWLKMQQKAVSLIHVQDEGLRKASVKFAETVVLALSYSVGPGSADHFTLDYLLKKGSECKLLDVRVLEEEGIRCVKSIAQLVLTSLEGNIASVKPDGSSTVRGLPPASFMTAVSVLGNLVRRRGKIIDYTLPPFLLVVPAVIGTSQPPCIAFQSLTEGQRQSIIAVLRFNLSALRGYPHTRTGRVGVDITKATNDLANFERDQEVKRRELATAMAARERTKKAAASAEAEKRRTAIQAHPMPALKRPRGADPSVPWPRLPPKEAFALSQSIIQSMPPQEVVNFIMTRLLLNIPAAHTVPGAQRTSDPNRNVTSGTADEPAPKKPRKSRFGSKENEQSAIHDQRPIAKKAVVRKVAPAVVPIRLTALGTEKLIAACCRRIMMREARAASSGASPLRVQLLARLLTKLAQNDSAVATKFCDEASQFIAADIKKNTALALAWLNRLAWEGEAMAYMETRPTTPPVLKKVETDLKLLNGAEEPNGVLDVAKQEPVAEKKMEDVEEGKAEVNDKSVDEKIEHVEADDAMEDGEQSVIANKDANFDLPPEEFEPFFRNPAYERTLTNLLSRLTEDASSEANFFSEIITESPILPVSVIERLKSFCHDPSRIKLGLHTLRDIVIKRPGNDRAMCLQIMLEFTIHEDEVLRGPAIRLIANKLFAECVGDVPESIERYAINSLKTAIDKLSGSPTSDEVNRVERGSLLLTALCGQRHDLLREICLFYTTAPSGAKKVLLSRAKDLAAHLGMSAASVTQLISAKLLPTPANESSPECLSDGLEDLALEVLRAVLKKFGKPSEELVVSAQRRYEISRNTEFIIAVLPGLNKEGILKHLSAIVSASYSSTMPRENGSRDEKVVSDATKTAGFKEIIGTIMGSRPAAVSPAELLIELHNIDPTAAASNAVRACFELKSVYKQESIAQSVQQLIEKTAIPDLFMRTVHLARRFYPELEKYLTETVMKRLIEKQVWKNSLLWEGYLLYCTEVREKSLKVLLSLPVAQLKDALDRQSVLRTLFKELVSNPRNAKKIQMKHRKVIAAAIKKAPAES